MADSRYASTPGSQTVPEPFREFPREPRLEHFPAGHPDVVRHANPGHRSVEGVEQEEGGVPVAVPRLPDASRVEERTLSRQKAELLRGNRLHPSVRPPDEPSRRVGVPEEDRPRRHGREEGRKLLPGVIDGIDVPARIAGSPVDEKRAALDGTLDGKAGKVVAALGGDVVSRPESRLPRRGVEVPARGAPARDGIVVSRDKSEAKRS